MIRTLRSCIWLLLCVCGVASATIGTSHHEPLMRAHDEWLRYGKGSWDYSKNAAKQQQFWRSSVERVKNDENIMSVGMRGDGDEAMSEETNVALLENTRVINACDASWEILPAFGRTDAGVTIFPVTARERQPSGKTPRLEYDFYSRSTGDVQVELHCAPSLDFQSGEGLRIAVSMDDAVPQVIRLDTWASPNWERAVAESVRRAASCPTIDKPGIHTLRVWIVTPGAMVERIVMDAGGVRPGYLGPPESQRIGAAIPVN